MGASPLIALCEEMIYLGAEIMFLACASWGLGEKYLQKGQVHLPSFAVGIDGTSPHYGNKDQKVVCETWCRDALATALNELDTSWNEGGVGSCEAIYQITEEMMSEFRDKGCLSIENGETAALYSLAQWRDMPIGVLLQPYIDLEKGEKDDHHVPRNRRRAWLSGIFLPVRQLRAGTSSRRPESAEAFLRADKR